MHMIRANIDRVQSPISILDMIAYRLFDDLSPGRAQHNGIAAKLGPLKAFMCRVFFNVRLSVSVFTTAIRRTLHVAVQP